MKFLQYISKIRRFVLCKNYRVSKYAQLGLYNHWTDERYLEKIFEARIGKKLNLKNPKTFNEKLQWLKIYDRKPIYTTMVDKFEAKKYVANIIGDEYIIPTLGVWEKFDDIDFDSLPNEFVLKCTHDSGGLVICKDKGKLNLKKAKRKIDKSLQRNYYFAGREWPYKNVKPRIIAEKFIEDAETQELRDYKFFAFDGVVKAMFVATERQKENEEVKFDFFDEDYNHLPMKNGHPNANITPQKPKYFDKMKALAEKLSEGIPHVRVDFYEANEKIYFGELTFFHFCGFVPMEPEEWDYKFGSYIKLPER